MKRSPLRPLLAGSVVGVVALLAAVQPLAAQTASEKTEAEILFSQDAGGLPRAAWGGLLQETRPEIRQAAGRLLASRPDPKLLFAVRRLAEDPVPAVRVEALIAAGRLGVAARSSIMANLAHKDPAVRQAAAWAACAVGEGFAEPILRRILVERDIAVQETLLGQAWRLPGRAWVPRVGGFARHAEPRLRRAAAASLARTPGSWSHGALRILIEDENEVVAATAARGFGGVELRDEDRAALLRALTGDRPRVQVAACQAWRLNASAEPDEATAAAIATLFRHDRAHVRAAALRAAIAHENVADVKTLMALASPSSWTGRLALEALAARGEGAAMATTALASADPVQARAGARAAARIGGRVLETALSDSRAGVRLAALEALTPAADAPWRDRVASLMAADPDAMVRAQAVSLMVGAGAVATPEALFELAGTWSGASMVDARAAALMAVFDLTEAAEPRRQAVQAALADPQRQVADLVTARARREGDQVWPVRRVPRRDRSWFLELVQWRKAERTLTLETRRGAITVRLDTRAAPISSREVWELARDGFYDGLVFHRVEPNFVVQGGDPRGDGWGGAGFTLPDEVSLQPFDTRRVGIATSGANTGSCQFFFMLTPADRLAGHFTNLGEVVSGQDVLEQLEIGDHILSVTVNVAVAPAEAP
jgi:cyclophilin family peptidyl-prolyl cis-trans isomerase